MTSEVRFDRSEKNMGQHFFRASAENFKKIPGSPIAYWVSDSFRNAFVRGVPLGEIAEPRQGMATSNNERFLRYFFEVSLSKISLDSGDHAEAKRSLKRWFPYSKGGEMRKWYGNHELVVNWEDDGRELLEFAASLYGSPTRTIKNIAYYFREALTWSLTSSGGFAARFRPSGFVFDVNGMSSFSDDSPHEVLSAVNSVVGHALLAIINPTMAFQAGDLKAFPFIRTSDPQASIEAAKSCVSIAKLDWDSRETSWEFSSPPLLSFSTDSSLLQAAYSALRSAWHKYTDELRQLEENNNQQLLDAYGLGGELDSTVQLSNVTLTCNPHYRYGGDKTEEELEALLLADTMREFISYAVGCMFGRYSLDKPGLVLANQGETLADYLRQVPQPTFTPDADNVIPLLDGEWFNDDITERFRSFLRVTFGETNYAENLKFIEDALGKDIRRFFLRDFYNDHVKRYKKRPIYWLFSSPKGSFNALIYLHRYRPDTVSVVLQYLRDFQEKLAGERKRQEQISINASASQAEKTHALKSIDSLKKILIELDDYERDVLHPLATRQVAIDLDDGVKVNYPKFGTALKKIVGLEAKDEE